MSDDIDTGGPGNSDLAPPPPPPPPPPVRPTRRHVIGRRGAAVAVASGLVVGGVAGGYVISQAASPTPSASASPSVALPGAPRGFAGAGPAARATDLQQVAAAIGITPTQLQTEMSAGKTIAAIATEHNVSTATVISTLVTDENAEIDAAVKAGTLTSTQATQMKTQTTQRVTDTVNGTEPAHGPGGRGFGGRGGMQGEDEQVIATAIGITTTQLQTELTAGKTVAAIATEHNIAASAVISALAASENSEIDKRVTAGQITAAQGTQEKTQTQQRATDEVNGTHPAGGFGPRGGLGPPPGAPAGSSTTTN